MYRNAIIILCLLIGISLHLIFCAVPVILKGISIGVILTSLISLSLIFLEHRNNLCDRIESQKRRRLQVLAEKELFRARERLALVIEGSCVGIWDWDLTTNCIYFSPIWKAQLGYEDYEITESYETWESLIHPDDKIKVTKLLKEFMEDSSKMYLMFDHRLRHKDGTYRNILANGAALRDKDGNVYRLAGSHVDISDLRDSQKKIKQLELDKAFRV